jgi:hypothetical protein
MMLSTWYSRLASPSLSLSLSPRLILDINYSHTWNKHEETLIARYLVWGLPSRPIPSALPHPDARNERGTTDYWASAPGQKHYPSFAKSHQHSGF